MRRMEQLQTQLSDVNAASNSLRSKVVELEEGNAVLQRENEELHSATLPSGPAYRLYPPLSVCLCVWLWLVCVCVYVQHSISVYWTTITSR